MLRHKLTEHKNVSAVLKQVAVRFMFAELSILTISLVFHFINAQFVLSWLLQLYIKSNFVVIWLSFPVPTLASTAKTSSASRLKMRSSSWLLPLKKHEVATASTDICISISSLRSTG